MYSWAQKERVSFCDISRSDSWMSVPCSQSTEAALPSLPSLPSLLGVAESSIWRWWEHDLALSIYSKGWSKEQESVRQSVKLPLKSLKKIRFCLLATWWQTDKWNDISKFWHSHLHTLRWSVTCKSMWQFWLFDPTYFNFSEFILLKPSHECLEI